MEEVEIDEPLPLPEMTLASVKAFSLSEQSRLKAEMDQVKRDMTVLSAEWDRLNGIRNKWEKIGLWCSDCK